MPRNAIDEVAAAFRLITIFHHTRQPPVMRSQRALARLLAARSRSRGIKTLRAMGCIFASY